MLAPARGRARAPSQSCRRMSSCALIDEAATVIADILPTAFRIPPSEKKCFVCFCEDVTPQDIAQAIAEGFDHSETLKRYTTAGMGPCQGKMCGQAVTEVCAQLTG